MLAALARLVLAATLAALTTLAALMLLTRPVLRALAALTSLPAALLRTLLLLVALRVLLLVRHWDILRLLVWENSPRRQSINAWQELKFLSLATPDTVNEL